MGFPIGRPRSKACILGSLTVKQILHYFAVSHAVWFDFDFSNVASANLTKPNKSVRREITDKRNLSKAETAQVSLKSNLALLEAQNPAQYCALERPICQQ